MNECRPLPLAVHGVVLVEVRGGLAGADLVDVHELELGVLPRQPQRQAPDAPEPVPQGPRTSLAPMGARGEVWVGGWCGGSGVCGGSSNGVSDNEHSHKNHVVIFCPHAKLPAPVRSARARTCVRVRPTVDSDLDHRVLSAGGRVKAVCGRLAKWGSFIALFVPKLKCKK